MRPRAGAAIVITLAALAGCSDGSDPDPEPRPSAVTPAPGPVATEPTSTAPGPPAAPAKFDVGIALHHIEVLAGRIGPRLTTGQAYRQAAAYVEKRLREQGYGVRRQGFPVPAGSSWGVPVDAGRSFNMIATPPRFDETVPYRIVGAHLDTVAVAPGAEDNASGISVLLELARLATTEGTALPTVLVAFGGEEPRGAGEDMHHFGSVHYVAELSRAARANLEAMVSLDRVGVGVRVPICSATSGGPTLRDALLATVVAGRIPTETCENDSSDHYSFVLDGLPGARVGGTSYAAYHDETDVPSVISRRQLGRTGRLIWAWLRPDRAS